MNQGLAQIFPALGGFLLIPVAYLYHTEVEARDRRKTFS